jgi:hypothetical protein
VFLLLFFVALLYLQPLQATAAPTGPAIELGYSPATLSPTSTGIPVYTTGDALWIMSEASPSLMVELSSPGGAVSIEVVISPQAPIMIYNFSGLDQPGTWTLGVYDAGVNQLTESFSVSFVRDVSIPLRMTEYSLSSAGQLSMNFSLSGSAGYDFQACAVGNPAPSTVSVPVPASLGSGSISVALNQSAVQVSSDVQVTTPFNFWVELHQDYSYTDGGTSTVVSRDMEVASSTAVPISGSNATSSPLQKMLQLRPGRFTLRAFFDSSAGLSASEIPVLLTGGNSSWISLKACVSASTLTSSNFNLSSTLGSFTQEWPQQVYLMYLEQGVEMYSMSPVQVQPAVLNVVASPWGSPLTDSQLTFRPGPDVQESASSGGVFYLTAKQYPVQVAISVLSGETRTVEIPSAYSYVTVDINSSKLVIDATSAGGGAPGASITVSSGNLTVSRGITNFGGTAVFYLPPGSYGISGSLGNTTKASTVVLSAGNSTVVVLTFPGSGGSGLTYAYLLTGTGIIGIGISAFIWVRVYRNRAGVVRPS